MCESIRSSGPETAFPPIERADGDATHAPGLQRFTDLGHGENRPDREVRVARSEDDRIRAREGFEHARRGPSFGGALVADVFHVVGVLSSHEPLLERKRAGGRVDVGAKPVVGGREDLRAHARTFDQMSRDAGQGNSGVEHLRPDEVEPDVSVAEPEPILPTPARC